MKNTSRSVLKKIEFNVHVLYNKLNILVFTKQYVQDYCMHILMYPLLKGDENKFYGQHSFIPQFKMHKSIIQSKYKDERNHFCKWLKTVTSKEQR